MRESNGSVCPAPRGRSRWRRPALLAALLLAGCGGGDFAAEAPATEGPGPATAAAAAPPEAMMAAAAAPAASASAPLAGVVIRQQPTSTDVREGSVATFRVEAEGPRPISYQWLRDGEPIVGATGPVLHWPASLADHLVRIGVVVRAGAATQRSDSAVLRVGPA